MNILENLNQQQLEAVLSSAKYLRIIAGAGSGKTRVLISRIAYLISEVGVPSKQILAITFTNKAANEMKNRIIKLLKDESAGAHISTIHSLCVRILREDITAINYPRNFLIIDQEDQKSILKAAYKEVDLDKQEFNFYASLNYISNNKGAFITPETALKMAGENKLEQKKALVYDFYQKRLHSLFALDFDDLLLVTLKIFKSYPSILEKWQKRFHYIHVDEFQDIDHVQYQIIKLLAGQDNSLYVVGDPDQTIYSWRGADINIIMNFEKDFHNPTTIILNENYRSTQNILNGANSIIHNNKNRVEKELFTSQEAGEKIEHFCAAAEEQEAYWVSSKIKELLDENVPYQEIAILYRSNFMSRFIEKGLLEQNIPYIIYGGVRFYERLEIKDALSYLRLIANQDDLAFLRVINTPKRGIGAKTIERIEEYAALHEVSLFTALAKLEFSTKVQAEVNKLIKLINEIRNSADQIPLEEVLDMVLDKTGYKHNLETSKEVERLENLNELRNDLRNFREIYPESTLVEYLQLVSLYTDHENYEVGNYVQLMTIHAAKGLEFEYVFVVGMSEGFFPSERTLAEGIKGLEEERRLAYVAFTRARKHLYLTESSGFNYILNKIKTTSRFILEIDREYLKQTGYRNDSKPDATTTLMSELDLVDYQSLNYKVGDMISHTVFGDGVVIKLNDGIAEIAFDFPIGIKKLNAFHHSISKKGA